MKCIFLILSLCLSSLSVGAPLPAYNSPDLLLRSGGLSNFNLPPMTFFTNSTAALNNRGDVALKMMAIEGEAVQGLWVKTAGDQAGKIVFKAPPEKAVTDPSLNDHGSAVFSIFEEGASEGVYILDLSNATSQLILPSQGTDLIAHSYPQILNNGDLFFRGTHTSEDHSFFQYSAKTLKPVLTEGQVFNGFQASYLFGPVVNNLRQWAFKIRVGSRKQWEDTRPDQIILLNPDGTSRQVAVDQKTDPRSPYTGFTNSVALSENGAVVFIATLSDGRKTLVLDSQGQQTRLATEGDTWVSELELFTPAINTQGVVAFRAKDSLGKRAVFLATRHEIQRLIGEDDEITSDLGPARIIADPNFPAFGGSVTLNDRNEICFYAVIVSRDRKELLGSAVYLQSPHFLSAPNMLGKAI